jgi:hypothetical protein
MSAKKKSIIGLVMFIAVMSIALIATEMLRAGQLTPSAPPGSTMKSLDQIPPSWSQIIPDGAKRFEVVMNGEAVLDKETGLVWLRSPDTIKRKWTDAYDYCFCLTAGGRRGWRLPSAEELSSLVDVSAPCCPQLTTGHPFQNVQGCCYWTSTAFKVDSNPALNNAVVVRIASGCPFGYPKSEVYGYTWPVRGGSGLSTEFRIP